MTDADRAKAAEVLRSDYSRRYLDDVAAALASERAAAVADLRARVLALTEDWIATALVMQRQRHVFEPRDGRETCRTCGLMPGAKVHGDPA